MSYQFLNKRIIGSDLAYRPGEEDQMFGACFGKPGGHRTAESAHTAHEKVRGVGPKRNTSGSWSGYQVFGVGRKCDDILSNMEAFLHGSDCVLDLGCRPLGQRRDGLHMAGLKQFNQSAHHTVKCQLAVLDWTLCHDYTTYLAMMRGLFI